MTRWSDILSKNHQIRRKSGSGGESKPNKYKAQRTALGFPSHLEETHYADLLYREKAGLVRDVKRYPSIKLTSRVTWKADFECWDLGLDARVIEESKGIETERFRLIKQLWPDFGPCLLRIYKGRDGRVWCAQTIKGNP